MKSDTEKIRERISAIETNILGGSNLTDFQVGCQGRIWTFCDEIREILIGMERKGS